MVSERNRSHIRVFFGAIGAKWALAIGWLAKAPPKAVVLGVPMGCCSMRSFTIHLAILGYFRFLFFSVCFRVKEDFPSFLLTSILCSSSPGCAIITTTTQQHHLAFQQQRYQTKATKVGVEIFSGWCYKALDESPWRFLQFPKGSETHSSLNWKMQKEGSCNTKEWYLQGDKIDLPSIPFCLDNSGWF